MLESLVALRDNAQHATASASRSNGNITRILDDDEYDDLPALEPVESSSSSSSSLSSRETPPAPVLSMSSLSQPVSASTTATSRFSTVVGNRSQERVFVDLVSEDEGDESESESEGEGALSEGVEQALVSESSGMGPERLERETPGRLSEDREMIWLDNDVVQGNSQETATSTSPDQAAGQSTNDINNGPTSLSLVENGPNQPAHDAEPSFVTDGRGRVVWSSMRLGRGGMQTEVSYESSPPPQTMHATSERRAKARRPGRENSSTADTTSSIGFTTDGRGRVIGTGSPVQADTAAGGHGEEAVATDVDAQSDAGRLAGPSQNRPRRSFFGRVYDVVFS